MERCEKTWRLVFSLFVSLYFFVFVYRCVYMCGFGVKIGFLSVFLI